MLKNQYYIELNKDIINSYDMERILGALEAEEEYNEKFDKEPYKGHIIPVTREGNHSLYLKVKSINGTITTNVYGKRYNTTEVSIMLYTKEFWKYWEMKAKQENAYLELYADKAITEIQI